MEAPSSATTAPAGTTGAARTEKLLKLTSVLEMSEGRTPWPVLGWVRQRGRPTDLLGGGESYLHLMVAMRRKAEQNRG